MSSYQTRADNDERIFAVAAHLSAIVAMIVSAGWLSFVGPLIVYFLARGRSSYVREAAAGSFNFNLWVWLITVIGWICNFTVILAPVGWVLWGIAALLAVVCHVWGALRALRGKTFRYPAQIRILK